MKHTPGPWKVAELFRDQRIVRPESGGYPLAAAYSQRDKFGKPHYNADANAHLIAAAPDMLSELRHVLAKVKDARGKGRISQSLALFLIERLEFIVSKAEGEQLANPVG